MLYWCVGWYAWYCACTVVGSFLPPRNTEAPLIGKFHFLPKRIETTTSASIDEYNQIKSLYNLYKQRILQKQIWKSFRLSTRVLACAETIMFVPMTITILRDTRFPWPCGPCKDAAAVPFWSSAWNQAASHSCCNHRQLVLYDCSFYRTTGNLLHREARRSTLNCSWDFFPYLQAA